MLLMILFMMVMMLTILLSSMGQILPKRSPDSKKISPYECGFDPIKSARLPFSFRFFLMAILFLMFDLEIALLLPLPISFIVTKTTKMAPPFMIFLSILTIGLYYEWVKGGLDWAKD